MDLKTLIILKFTWGNPRHKNSVNGIYLDGKQLLCPQPRKYKDFGIDIESGHWASNPMAAAFAICKELYGEILAHQLSLHFCDWFMEAVYQTRTPIARLDLSKFHAQYLSTIHYYDFEALVSWYAEPLHVNMHQDAQTATFKFLRVPLTRSYQSAFGPDLIDVVLGDFAEKLTYLEIMHNHTIREITFRPSESIETFILPKAEEG